MAYLLLIKVAYLLLVTIAYLLAGADPLGSFRGGFCETFNWTPLELTLQETTRQKFTWS